MDHDTESPSVLPDLQMVTSEQIMNLLCISRSTLERLTKADNFPKPWRVGDSTHKRWLASDIRDYIERQVAASKTK